MKAVSVMLYKLSLNSESGTYFQHFKELLVNVTGYAVIGVQCRYRVYV